MSIVTPAVQQWIERGLSDPETFWAEAADHLPWFRRWDRVFEWNPPTFRWFAGAETNLAHNALNSSAVQTYNQTLGPAYLTPTLVLPARFAKISAQIDF